MRRKLWADALQNATTGLDCERTKSTEPEKINMPGGHPPKKNKLNYMGANVGSGWSTGLEVSLLRE